MEAYRELDECQQNRNWIANRAQLLTSANLRAVFDGSIPAIVLPQFISNHDCDSIVANLIGIGMGTYSHVSHPVGRLGLAQMEFHLKNDKHGYFNQVSSADQAYKNVIGSAEDPVQKLISYLAHTESNSTGVAKESTLGNYFAGTFRNVMTLGHLHFDFAPFEAQGWDIANIQSQLSWNLYLNQPTGGNLKVYNRFYSPEDESLRVAEQYYYDDSIVSNVDEFSYSPKVGDVVIFNSRNIHEVERVTGDRYSLSSFIGKKKNGDLILWS